MSGCDVDLSAPPYGVVPDDISAGPANTGAINKAIIDFSGKKARLVLPAGEIYVDQAEGHKNWSIKFPPGVSDLALVGHGMYSTRIIIQGEGDFGDWHGIMVDGASRIELANFGIQMGIVDKPDKGSENHLISVLRLHGTTDDVVGHNIFFGQAVGDGLRILGDVGPVTNVRFTDFVMRMAGIARGARSGVALHRGWNVVELGNFYIDGVKNSPIDMEPGSKNPFVVSHLNIHDGFIDQSHGQSDVAIALGGESHGDRAQHVRVTNVTVVEGRVRITSTDNLHIRGLTVVAKAAFKAALVVVRQRNDNLRLDNLYLERAPGSTAGPLLDVENAGNATTIAGGTFIQSTNGHPLTFDGTSNLRVHGPRVSYEGRQSSKCNGINVVAQIGNADNLQIDAAQVLCSRGKLHAAVSVAARAGRSMTNMRISNLHSAGAATTGMYISYHPKAMVDSTPLLSGVDNGTDTTWKQVDQNDKRIRTVCPIIAGNPGGVCEMVGEHKNPNVVATAVQGSIYTFQNGDATRRFVKATGTGTPGWVQLT